MAPRVLRWVVIGICAAGVAGMIVASILDAGGAALTFGLVTAVAVTCLIVATAVAAPATVDDDRSTRVEELVDRLVRDGADEATVRALVAEMSGRRESRGGGARRTHPEPRRARE